MNINDQDKAVAAYLTEIGVHFNVSLIAEMLNDEWQHDLFNVIMHAKGKQPEVTQYKTGIGHRVDNRPNSRKLSARDNAGMVELKALYGGERVLYPAKHNVSTRPNRKCYDAQYVVTPTQASILHCLILDASALDTCFNDWCDDYGYDSDSMTAFKTYQACCEEGEQLRKIFTHEQKAHLQTLLEDY